MAVEVNRQTNQFSPPYGRFCVLTK